MRKTVFIALILLLLVLHQDFWNWREYQPLLFGFLPIGLTYHAAYAVACSVLLWLLTRYLWPTHLESVQSQESRDRPK